MFIGSGSFLAGKPVIEWLVASELEIVSLLAWINWHACYAILAQLFALYMHTQRDRRQAGKARNAGISILSHLDFHACQTYLVTNLAYSMAVGDIISIFRTGPLPKGRLHAVAQVDARRAIGSVHR